MKIPDRPALNILLGIVFALVVLGVLSTPALVGSQAPSLLVSQNTRESNAGGVASSNPSVAVSSSASSTSIPTSSISSLTLSTGFIPSQTSRGNESNSGSSYAPVPTNSTSGSFAAASTSITTVVASTSAVVSNEDNLSRSLATSVAQEETTMISLNSSVTSSPLTAYSVVAAGSGVDSHTFLIFGLISVSSVIVAAGSMLLVYRRVRNEGDSE
jgi:hypothetical protein